MKRAMFSLLVFLGVILTFHSGNLGAATAVNKSEEAHYKLDPTKSTFIVHADRTGIAWFKGKSHFIAARDFSGEASMTTDLLNPSSLTISVRTASLEETGAAFTDQQKGIIKKELDELVLDSAKYPEILFRSTQVKGKFANGAFDVRIEGDLTLHGVTKHITIPANVTISGDQLRAKGEFTVNRKKFGVNATDAFHGFVRVKHKLRFTFDIIGNRT